MRIKRSPKHGVCGPFCERLLLGWGHLLEAKSSDFHSSIYGGVVMLDLNMGIKQVSIRVDKYLQQLLASTDDNDYVDPLIYYVCYLMWRKCGGNRKSERVRAIAQPSLS